ncbi:MAG: TIGR03013 family PEP-CTERM/XrtA system glycosyltransferase [Deltaproteobacteria bacterium]|nr:TIGR03013 family PEP-CTERM/XrtA system glycosyltransferase [Deltaproteobacteria bacterium]
MLRLLKQYYPIRNAVFVIGEAFVIFFSVLIAYWFIIDSNILGGWLYCKIFLISFIVQACLYYNNLYNFKVIDGFTELSIRLFQAVGFAAIILAVIYFFFPGAIIGKGVSGISIALILIFITSWRLCYTLVLERGLFNQQIIILGSGELANNIKIEIETTKDCGYTVKMIFKEDADTDRLNATKITISRSGYDGLCEIAKDLNIDKIVVALKEKRGAFPVKELLNCRVAGIDVLEGNSFYEMLTGKLIVEQINPGWLIFSKGFKKSFIMRAFKRCTDFFLSLSMLIMFSPLIILTSILIKMDSEGPILFSQERMGQNGIPYDVYKFRSMFTDAEKNGPVWATTDDNRVTRVGKYIRKWRIDEIPQLWNVMIGEMSFVGPRPEREHFVKELEAIIPYYSQRFNVKPGLTGWAQVSYGYGATVDEAIEKLNYDLFYIKNMSIPMDLTVIFRTVKTVLFGEGAR